ncbi:hypothetical protein KIN20_007702, partial [Parelaphostrongylus tenuis]
VVGCDDMIGSSLRFDVCGFCGGRGDTCDSAQFVWKESGEFTKCANTCAEAAKGFHGGHEGDDRESRSIIVCVNADTGRVVPERLCADRKRPAVRVKPCPPLICPSRILGTNDSVLDIATSPKSLGNTVELSRKVFLLPFS